MIDAVLGSLSEPFTTTIGWQAFFMGLLGLKGLKKIKDFVVEFASRNDVTDEEVSESE